MTSNTLFPNARIDPETESTLVSFVAFPLVLIALFAAISYPLAAVAVSVSTIVAVKALRIVVSRSPDRIRKLTIPGVGTVQYRITPR